MSDDTSEIAGSKRRVIERQQSVTSSSKTDRFSGANERLMDAYIVSAFQKALDTERWPYHNVHSGTTRDAPFFFLEVTVNFFLCMYVLVLDAVSKSVMISNFDRVFYPPSPGIPMFSVQVLCTE